MSFLTTSMRVAVQNRHRKQAGHRFRIEMRAGDGTSRNTLCGPAFPLIENLPAIHSVASMPLSDWIAAFHPWQRKLRTAIEATRTHKLLAVRSLVRGQRTICNFCRLQAYTAGKCFSFRTLVHDANQSASVLRILFSPFHSAEPLFLGSIALSDGHRVSERKAPCPDQSGSNPHQNRARR